MTKSPFQAVLFDLDDTLYDHLHAARAGMIGLRKRNPAMQRVSVEELEELNSESLERIHTQLLHGEFTQDEARTLRMQELFGHFDMKLDAERGLAEYNRYRRDYDAACRVVAGSRELLAELSRRGLRLGIITNNLVAEQTAKLRQLGLEDTFEVVTISEGFGVPKPAPEIFLATLEKLELGVTEAVMVGDSLTSDIAGGLGVGLRCVWLDRQPKLGRNAPKGVPTLQNDFTDWAHAAAVIAGAPTSAA